MRKYVQTKKRKMKAGEAFVGMKRRGSQLRNAVRTIKEGMPEGNDLLTCEGKTSRR